MAASAACGELGKFVIQLIKGFLRPFRIIDPAIGACAAQKRFGNKIRFIAVENRNMEIGQKRVVPLLHPEVGVSFAHPCFRQNVRIRAFLDRGVTILERFLELPFSNQAGGKSNARQSCRLRVEGRLRHESGKVFGIMIFLQSGEDGNF